MNKIKNKLKSKSGESLVEILVAILVGTFSVLLLTTVISTATKLDAKSRDTLNTYYAANNELAELINSTGESGNDSVSVVQGYVTITPDGGSAADAETHGAIIYTNSSIGSKSITAYTVTD